MSNISLRLSLAVLFLLATGGFLFALFSQHVLGMQPCAWCILQRMICVAIAVVAGLGWLWHRHAARLASLVAGLLAVAGVIAAWFQHTVAARQFSCDLSLADRLVSGSGLDAALPSLFGIYATCAEASVNLFGVAYEVWSLLLFALMGVIAVAGLWAAGRHGKS